MKVAEWIRRFPQQIVTIHPKSSLEQAVDLMLSQPCVQDIYVISEANFVLGHLSHKRLTSLLLAEHRPTHSRRQIMERVVLGTAGEFMEGEFVFARPDEELDDVFCRFIDHDLQDIVVIDDSGVLAGGIHLNTVLRELRKSPDIIH